MVSAAFFACLASLVRAADKPPPSRVAVGVNVVGAQVDYALTPKLRAEARYVTGNSDTVTSSAVGLRGYRLFGGGATRFYLGGEAARVKSKQSGNSYRVTGLAAGGFIGLERKIAGRLWAGVDAGPYFFTLRESATGAEDTSVDFVLNSFLRFYLF
jgi:hypothetical protein